jgi:hypothetical protein|tara:strand:+ start:176 stop:415 length:240 start_codon:yes stop_codon:yes gene_type:complete
MMSKKDKLKKYSVTVSKTISVLASDEYEAEEQAKCDFIIDISDLECEVNDEDEIEKYGDVNQGLGTWNGYEYVKTNGGK